MRKKTYREIHSLWNERAQKNTIDIIKKTGDVFWDDYEKRLVRKALFYCKKKPKMLDLGCGTGRLSGFLYDKGLDVTAIDYSEEAIKKLKKKYPYIKCVHADITDLSQITEKYDCIVLCRTLQSLPSTELKIDVLKQVREKLNIGGKILLIEGNANRLTKHPSYNFYLAFKEWETIFNKINYKMIYKSAIPLSTLLAMFDGKLTYKIRKILPMLYHISYCIDGFIGSIQPGFVSHQYAIIVEKNK